jgi:hypothetical protein
VAAIDSGAGRVTAARIVSTRHAAAFRTALWSGIRCVVVPGPARGIAADIAQDLGGNGHGGIGDAVMAPPVALVEDIEQAGLAEPGQGVIEKGPFVVS